MPPADGEDLVDLSVAELAHYLHLHLDKDHPVVHSVVNTQHHAENGHRKMVVDCP